MIRVSNRNIAVPGLSKFGMHRYSNARVPIRRHAHPHAIEIIYLASGRQYIEIDDERYEMRGNDVLITPPGMPHGSSFHPAEKCALYFLAFAECPPLFGFHGSEASAVLSAFRSPVRRFFPGTARMKTIFDDAIRAYTERSPYVRSVLMSRFTEFLIEVLASAHGERSAVSPPILRAIRYVDEHVGEPIMVAHLADIANMTVQRTKRLFTAEAGIPPKEFILRRKIERASVLLLDKHMPITDIGLSLGFSSSQHFATMFKRYTGRTPIQHRRSGGE